jgi:ferredoxin
MISRKAYLHFSKDQTSKPFVYSLIKEFNLVVNIFRSKVNPGSDGYLSVELEGTAEDLERGLAYLKNNGVEIHAGNVGLFWDRSKCTDCTHCTVYCPTEALHICNSSTREIAFDESKCIECLACVTSCPFGACSSIF